MKLKKKVFLFKKKYLISKIILIFFFIGFFYANYVLAEGYIAPMSNPAAVYCEEMGYKYSIESTAEGDFGFCNLPDGTKADEWNFLQGKEGAKYSYCQKKGYEIKVVTGKQCNYSVDCAVCVLANGEEAEVSQLLQKEKIEELKNVTPDQSISQKTEKDRQGDHVLLIIFIMLLFIIVIIFSCLIFFRSKKEKNL